MKECNIHLLKKKSQIISLVFSWRLVLFHISMLKYVEMYYI